MQEIVTNGLVDRSKWSRGPWDDEPDKKQWIDEATGLPCLVVRSPLGHLCGYVGVSNGHPLFEKSYWDADVDVHGGPTYSDHCGGDICHLVEDGDDDNVWWIGFDCAHSGDASPWRDDMFRSLSKFTDLLSGVRSFGTEAYRSFAYVERECKSLASQLSAMVSATT